MRTHSQFFTKPNCETCARGTQINPSAIRLACLFISRRLHTQTASDHRSPISASMHAQRTCPIREVRGRMQYTNTRSDAISDGFYNVTNTHIYTGTLYIFGHTFAHRMQLNRYYAMERLLPPAQLEKNQQTRERYIWHERR